MKIILIDGNQRSGTNYFSLLLNQKYKLIQIPGDFDILSELLRHKNKINSSTIKNKKILKIIQNTKYFKNLTVWSRNKKINKPKGTYGDDTPFNFDFREFILNLNKLKISTFENLLLDIIFYAALSIDHEVDSNSNILIKNHEIGLYYHNNEKFFSNLKYIQIVRHPYNFFYSQKKRYSRIDKWGFKRAKKEIEKYRKLKLLLIKNKNLNFIRYEDLLDNKNLVLNEVKKNFQLTERVEMLNDFTFNNSSFDSKTNRIDGIDISSYIEKMLIKYLCKDVNAFFNYDIGKIGFIEKLFFLLFQYLHKHK